MNDSSSRQALRQRMRRQRRALTPAQQRRAGEKLARHIARQSWFRRSKRIAAYWPADGEIDPLPLIRLAWRTGKHCYLPVLHPWIKRQLWFCAFTPRTRFKANRYGIPEPQSRYAAPVSPQHLDLVLLPLVAFDALGGRLGMGGGFYDATFAFKNRVPGFTPPRLIGTAHRFQQVERLTLASWDIPLDGVVTEEGVVV